MITATLAELTDRDRETLEAWLIDFDLAWQPDSLSTWANTKLPTSHPLRRVALAEMVQVDLERQWQRGNRWMLESYLERYPELGTAETISADLILAEYQVRQQFGAPAELSDFARRFPRQAGELPRLIEYAVANQSVGPLSFEQPPAVAEQDTSRAGLKTDTAVRSPLVLEPRSEGTAMTGLSCRRPSAVTASSASWARAAWARSTWPTIRNWSGKWL